MGRPVLKFGMYHVLCRITPHFENRPLIEFPLLRLWITTQTNVGFLMNTPTSGSPEKKFPPAKISVWLASDSTCSDILYTGNPFWGREVLGWELLELGLWEWELRRRELREGRTEMVGWELGECELWEGDLFGLELWEWEL